MSNKQPVAVVTGSSRGAGRGIAIALGSHGCTVYVTGRSEVSGDSSLPGTIHETAAAVTSAGGRGIAIRCDHANDEQVARLFDLVKRDEGRVDILVNNAAAVHDELTQPGEFWEKPLKLSDMINVGVRSGYVASWHAAPVMAAQDCGLIVFTSASGAAHYSLGPAYGAQKAAVDKMAFDMAADFRHAGTQVACISVWMGGLLTDRMKSVIASDPAKYGHLQAQLETPEFTGEIIWKLFNDPDLAQLSGRTLVGAEIARKYNLADASGRVPPTARELHDIAPFEYYAVAIR